jgi:hypothetical protein
LPFADGPLVQLQLVPPPLLLPASGCVVVVANDTESTQNANGLAAALAGTWNWMCVATEGAPVKLVPLPSQHFVLKAAQGTVPDAPVSTAQ